MPAFQPDTIIAGADNGISLDPVSNQNGLAVYAGRVFEPDLQNGGSKYVSDAAVLQPTFTISLQRPSKTSRLSKGRMKLVFPKPVMDNGVVTAVKSHDNSIDITLMSSEKASAAERAVLLDLAINALSKPDFREVFVNNKSMY